MDASDGAASCQHLCGSPERNGEEQTPTKSAAEPTTAKTGKLPLLDYSALPEYLQDNEYIHKHYRADWSLKQTLWSIFGIHNETGNIWTHLVGFILFLIITVYTATKIPSVIEIPLSTLTFQRLQQQMPTPPSLASLRDVLPSQLPQSLAQLELPQLKQLQRSLSQIELPQLKHLQSSLSRIDLSHLPQLEHLRKNLAHLPHLPDLHIPSRLEALYKSLPAVPSLEISARLGAMYESIPSLMEISRVARASGESLYHAMPSFPKMEEMSHAAEPYFSALSEGFSSIPNMVEGVQDAVAEGWSSLPNMQDVAGPYLAAVADRMPKMPKVQGTAESYMAALAERLSHLEVLHTVHRLELLLQGPEVTRMQEAVHSLISYYSCLVNSMITHAAAPQTCPLHPPASDAEGAMCRLLGSGSSVNKTYQESRALSPMAAEAASNDAAATCPAPMLYSAPTVRWPLFLFLGGAMVCLLCSTVCHLFGCVSCNMSKVIWRFDYAGIAALISTSFFPPVFYGFLCQPIVRTVYLVAVVSMGVLTIIVSLMPSFQSPQYRHLRAGLFFGMGVSGLIPCAHKFLFYYDEPMVVYTTLLELLMGSLYGLGALFYATRIPERWLPGKFDIAGHSHQIFHVLVIAGAYTHYRTGLLYLQWRDLHGCGV